MKVTLYSTGCPKCRILKRKLEERGIQYVECADEQVMLAMGLREVPVLDVDGVRYAFGEAVRWVAQLQQERSFSCKSS